MKFPKKKRVTVYSTESCPYCYMVKDFLNEHNIPFEDIDVGKNREAAQEMIRKTGQMGVPVIEIDGKIIIGFDQEALKQELDLD